MKTIIKKPLIFIKDTILSRLYWLDSLDKVVSKAAYELVVEWIDDGVMTL